MLFGYLQSDWNLDLGSNDFIYSCHMQWKFTDPTDSTYKYTSYQSKFNRTYIDIFCVSVKCVGYAVILTCLFVQGKQIRDIIAYCLLHEVINGD